VKLFLSELVNSRPVFLSRSPGLDNAQCRDFGIENAARMSDHGIRVHSHKGSLYWTNIGSCRQLQGNVADKQRQRTDMRALGGKSYLVVSMYLICYLYLLHVSCI